MMKFAGMEHFDDFGDEVYFWLTISDVPKAIQILSVLPKTSISIAYTNINRRRPSLITKILTFVTRHS